MEILKIILNFFAFGAFAGAFLIHLAHKQSRSYFIMLGYGFGCFAMIHEVIESGSILNLRWWFWSYFLLGIGESLRFLKREDYVERFLKMKASKEVDTYTFDYFKEFPINEEFHKDGRVVTKLKESEKSITMLIKYSAGSRFVVESDDYDLAYSLQNGNMDVNVLGKVNSLKKKGDMVTIKRNYPFELVINDDSIVTLIISKR